MKKKVTIVLMAAVLVLSPACSHTVPDEVKQDEQYEYVSVLSDKHFENGFYMNGLWAQIYGDPIECYGEPYSSSDVFDYEKGLTVSPSWNVHQAASRYPWHDKGNTVTEIKNGKETFNYRFTDLGRGKYLYENQSKDIEVNTLTGEIRLALRGSECYRYDRVAGQEWPHLLLLQSIGTPQSMPRQTRIRNTDSIVVNVDLKLNGLVDYMGDRANPGLHACGMMFYLELYYMPSRNVGFTDMLYLGMSLFDNRARVPGGGSSFPDEGSKGSATGKWIYNIASTDYITPSNNLFNVKGEPVFNEWKNVNIDMYPYIKRALNDAHNAGYMKEATMDKLYIHQVYIGFEIPGTYDLDMSIRNLDVESYIQV